jgi:hypothetical protein
VRNEREKFWHFWQLAKGPHTSPDLRFRLQQEPIQHLTPMGFCVQRVNRRRRIAYQSRASDCDGGESGRRVAGGKARQSGRDRFWDERGRETKYVSVGNAVERANSGARVMCYGKGRRVDVSRRDGGTLKRAH